MISTEAPTQQAARPALGTLPAPRIDIVVPVYNEGPRSRTRSAACTRSCQRNALRLADRDRRQRQHRRARSAMARALAFELDHVTVAAPRRQGPGRALRAAWTASDADVLCYMDVDLSTDLRALLPLVSPLVWVTARWRSARRLAPGARVVRGPKREVISRCYNGLLRHVLRARFSDAQCGFKAIRADAARALLPRVRTRAGSLTPSCSILAQRRGLRIHEVAVDWIDDPDSRVDIVSTALADLRGVMRLLFAAPVARFCRSAWPRRSPTRSCTCCCARPLGRRRRKRRGAGADGGGQHPGQPPHHLRHPRPRGLLRQHAGGRAGRSCIALWLTDGALDAAERA